MCVCVCLLFTHALPFLLVCVHVCVFCACSGDVKQERRQQRQHEQQSTLFHHPPSQGPKVLRYRNKPHSVTDGRCNLNGLPPLCVCLCVSVCVCVCVSMCVCVSVCARVRIQCAIFGLLVCWFAGLGADATLLSFDPEADDTVQDRANTNGSGGGGSCSRLCQSSGLCFQSRLGWCCWFCLCCSLTHSLPHSRPRLRVWVFLSMFQACVLGCWPWLCLWCSRSLCCFGFTCLAHWTWAPLAVCSWTWLPSCLAPPPSIDKANGQTDGRTGRQRGR